MKKASVSFLALITLIGLVFGGFLLSSPSQTAPSNTVDTALLYRSNTPVSGNKNAQVKITVFSDYLCPYCSNANKIIEEIFSEYKDNVSIYHRSLIVHESSEILTRAALAADKQGKFIEFNNILFEREIEASQQTVEDIATELQMDIDKFRSDLNSSETTNTIDQDEEDADNLQITGTPTIFVNDQRVEDFRELSSLVKDMV
jgi:protein-disulfide isomerase